MIAGLIVVVRPATLARQGLDVRVGVPRFRATVSTKLDSGLHLLCI